MARHLFAITLMVFGGLLSSPAQAVNDAPRCENNAANCIGRCANPGGGVWDNKCMKHCDRQLVSCVIRANESVRRR